MSRAEEEKRGGEEARRVARHLLVRHVLERRVHAVSALRLLQHGGKLQLADELVELFRAEEHRIHRRRVHELLVVQAVHPLQVVPRARVLIREDLVSLSQLLEFLVGVRVVDILIRVHLPREHEVGRRGEERR